MKYTVAALTALCSIVCMTGANRAEAGGGRTIRADLPCPFGPGGDPWTSSGTAAGSPFNPGITGATASATLSGPITFDDNSLTTTSATQYAYYDVPLPSAASCTESPDPTPPPTPVVQVIDFTMAADQSLGGVLIPTGATEVEFNYDATSSLVSGATGPASFTMGGVTYTSSGAGVPTNTLNDFFFNTNGSLIGGESEDQSTILTGQLPLGWTAKPSGTISAPEMDASSAAAALTLLFGGLAVLRGGRRTRVQIR
jgi:hypothetical protein